jgi:ElaB/YqjD/DUF883 family membrane-anchored ribosome-binding protein
MSKSKSASSSSTSASDKNTGANGSGEDLATTAAEAGEQVQQQVSNLTEQVRQQATSQLTSQKERAVETLDTVALLLRQAGEHAQQQEKAMLAGYVDKAAGQVDHLSTTLREQDMTQILDETKAFARRQPMLFVGGALAAGFLGARFFRSSSQQMEQGQTGSSSTNAGSDASTMPPYDIDQYGSGATGTALDTSASLQTDTAPDTGGILMDYEGAVLEGEDLGAISEAELDDLTSPETR